MDENLLDEEVPTAPTNTSRSLGTFDATPLGNKALPPLILTADTTSNTKRKFCPPVLRHFSYPSEDQDEWFTAESSPDLNCKFYSL